LFALTLGLGLILGVALVSTIDCLLLGRDRQCLVLEGKDFPIALDVKSDLGIADVDDSSGSVQEWSSQNDRRPLIGTRVHYCEVCRNI